MYLGVDKTNHRWNHVSSVTDLGTTWSFFDAVVVMNVTTSFEMVTDNDKGQVVYLLQTRNPVFVF